MYIVFMCVCEHEGFGIYDDSNGMTHCENNMVAACIATTTKNYIVFHSEDISDLYKKHIRSAIFQSRIYGRFSNFNYNKIIIFIDL